MRLKRDTDAWRAQQGKASLEIAKQRNGPTCVVPLTWRGECVRFENYAPEERPGQAFEQHYLSAGQDPSPDRSSPF